MIRRGRGGIGRGKQSEPGVRTLRDGREICSHAFWMVRRREVWVRDGRRCVFCGRALSNHAAEIDHIKTRGMGGGSRDDRLSNLRTLCHDCHMVRHGEKR